MGKDGKEYKQILIPNKDENDHSPWATFVARSNAVHEDQYGKGMWMKLPADGHTTVRKDHCVGEGADGKKDLGDRKDQGIQQRSEGHGGVL